jgi:hypothetical protein
MDSQASPFPDQPLAGAPAAGNVQYRPATLLQRTLVFPIKFLWGMLFCQGLLGSILVVGWSYRLAQRAALRSWFSRSSRPQSRAAFGEFLADQDFSRHHADWPNWFLQQDFRDVVAQPLKSGLATRLVVLLRGLVHSLWLNFRIGLRGILCAWALTLPAGVLWWFGWYDGWNNSFNKGYEQAAVGPLISVLGIVWFIVAMFYVPLAQARQAITGEWRSFFDFRFLWRLARANRLACAGLALLYCAFAVPLNILKVTPMFWPQMNPALADLSATRALSALNHYYFWCALVMFPAYVALRVVAARIYAAAVLRTVQLGQTTDASLHRVEREALDRLGLLELRLKPQRSALVRFVTWSTTRVGRVVATTALIFLGFAFVAQIYISEFFCYHGALAWLNQPLVQLPWFHYVPAGLKSPWHQPFLLLLFWLVATLIASVGRIFLRSKSIR